MAKYSLILYICVLCFVVHGTHGFFLSGLGYYNPLSGIFNGYPQQNYPANYPSQTTINVSPMNSAESESSSNPSSQQQASVSHPTPGLQQNGPFPIIAA